MLLFPTWNRLWVSFIIWLSYQATDGSVLPYNNKLTLSTLTDFISCLPYPKHFTPFANTTTIITDPDYVVKHSRTYWDWANWIATIATALWPLAAAALSKSWVKCKRCAFEIASAGGRMRILVMACGEASALHRRFKFRHSCSTGTKLY